jgi:hypothetical protein
MMDLHIKTTVILIYTHQGKLFLKLYVNQIAIVKIRFLLHNSSFFKFLKHMLKK